ncbi:DNA alkylation response protein, partial [Escherichia coli]|nr:DNA alkylation response protein [Escherichia coli]
RMGRRVDEVEFHPSYHALMAAAAEAGLHGSPWQEAAHGHVRRAASFMLFTEAEPSILCPISMTYAVMAALGSNPAIYQDWAPGLKAR